MNQLQILEIDKNPLKIPSETFLNQISYTENSNINGFINKIQSYLIEHEAEIYEKLENVSSSINDQNQIQNQTQIQNDIKYNVIEYNGDVSDYSQLLNLTPKTQTFNDINYNIDDTNLSTPSSSILKPPPSLFLHGHNLRFRKSHSDLQSSKEKESKIGRLQQLIGVNSPKSASFKRFRSNSDINISPPTPIKVHRDSISSSNLLSKNENVSIYVHNADCSDPNSNVNPSSDTTLNLNSKTEQLKPPDTNNTIEFSFVSDKNKAIRKQKSAPSLNLEVIQHNKASDIVRHSESIPNEAVNSYDLTVLSTYDLKDTLKLNDDDGIPARNDRRNNHNRLKINDETSTDFNFGDYQINADNSNNISISDSSTPISNSGGRDIIINNSNGNEKNNHAFESSSPIIANYLLSPSFNAKNHAVHAPTSFPSSPSLSSSSPSLNNIDNNSSTTPITTSSTLDSMKEIRYIQVSRKLIYSFSQISSSIKKYNNFCSDKKLGSRMAILIHNGKMQMDHLVDVLEVIEASDNNHIHDNTKTTSTSAIDDNEKEQKSIQQIIHACKDCIFTFKSIISLIKDNIDSFTKFADVRYTRTLLMALFGSSNEIYNAWFTLFPQAINRSPMVLSPDNNNTQSQNRYNNHASSNTPSNHGHKKFIPSPLNLHVATFPSPSLSSIMNNSKNNDSISDLSQYLTADSRLYEVIKTATNTAQSVFNQLLENFAKSLNDSNITDGVNENENYNDNRDSKIKDSVVNCSAAIEISKILQNQIIKAESLQDQHQEVITDNKLKRKIWENINNFLKAVITICLSLKTSIINMPSLYQLRPQITSLTRVTKEIPPCLEVSSYRDLENYNSSSTSNNASMNNANQLQLQQQQMMMMMMSPPQIQQPFNFPSSHSHSQLQSTSSSISSINSLNLNSSTSLNSMSTVNTSSTQLQNPTISASTSTSSTVSTSNGVILSHKSSFQQIITRSMSQSGGQNHNIKPKLPRTLSQTKERPYQ